MPMEGKAIMTKTTTMMDNDNDKVKSTWMIQLECTFYQTVENKRIILKDFIVRIFRGSLSG